MKAKSIRGRGTSDIESAINNIIADAQGFQPTLAIVFISIKQDRARICQLLRSKSIDVVGATSAGEFIDGHHSEGEIAILLLDINKDFYRIIFKDTHQTEVEAAAKDAAATANATYANPGLILCSTCFSKNGEMYPGEMLIHTIQTLVGSKTPIFGGMSGDDGTLTGTYVFDNHEESDEGFILLVLDNDKVDLYGMALSGWKPIGKVRTVTKSEDGWIYEFDGQPALDMYLRYLGQSLEPGETKNVFREDIGFYYPFMSIDSGEPALRTPLEVDRTKNAIKLDVAIPEGKQLQFTLPPDFDIVETVLENASILKAERNASADALLVFSCLGRKSALGPMVHEENEGLYKIWDAPMAGYFSYGEFGKDLNSDHMFHSTTCSWIALKEK